VPNIEIHGFPQEAWPESAWDLREKIYGLLQPWKDHAVVTICDTDTRNLNGEPRPFLRVWDTDPERAKEVARQLMSLGMEMEEIVLTRFYPSQEDALGIIR